MIIKVESVKYLYDRQINNLLQSYNMYALPCYVIIETTKIKIKNTFMNFKVILPHSSTFMKVLLFRYDSPMYNSFV